VAGVERSLVHCDLLNRNVLVRDGEVTGLLDWGCSLYGDFLYDIAQVEFWEPWYPAIAASGIRERATEHYTSTGMAVHGFADRMKACLVHIGLVHQAYTASVGRLDDLHAITHRLHTYLA
jgi:hygromycin-B 4-O-kinase